MNAIIRRAASAAVILGFSTHLWGQFLPDEITQRSLQENWLRTAEIVQAQDIGEGVTHPIRLDLRCPAGDISGCWKNPAGVRQGFLEGWRFEIAAYRLDKLLGLGMIPPTVERSYKGRRGSLQLWIESPYSLLDIMEQKLTVPAAMRDNDRKMKYIIRAFDCLIANEDRTQQNIRYTADWRVVLIDHSRAFRSSAKFTRRLMYGKNGIKGEKLIRILPRSLVERIRGLTDDQVQSAAGEYLEKKEIDALLKRKRLLLAEIDAMIQANGEDAVLY